MAAPNAMVERGEKLRAATRELLIEEPRMDRGVMHQEVLKRTGLNTLRSSWEVTYYYPVRKELREQGVIGNGKKKTAQERGRRPRPEAPKPEPVVETTEPVEEEAPATEKQAADIPENIPAAHAFSSISIRQGDNAYHAQQAQDGTWSVSLDVHGIQGELVRDLFPMDQILPLILEL